MRHVAPVRRAMGVRTIFNIMGPLSNPAQPSHQVSGTFDLRTQRLYSWSFERMGVKRQWCMVWTDMMKFH